MSSPRAPLVLLGFLLAHCTEAPKPVPWKDQALLVTDSVHTTIAAYGERFHAADRDSLMRFYTDSPKWAWAADGRVGTPSSLMMRSRLDGLAAYPRWSIWYTNLSVVALVPGLATVTTDYRMTLTGGSKKGLAYEGALTMFWEHQCAGWKVVGGHSSPLTVASR